MKNKSLIIIGVLFFLLCFPSLLFAETKEGKDLDEGKVNPSVFYSSPSEVSDTINENTTGAQNIEKSKIKDLVAIPLVLIQGIDPCIFENCEKITSTKLRKGFGGLLEDEIIAMFDRQPSVNVVAHLADEWVPGYKDTNSIYAGGFEDLESAGIVDIWSTTRNIAYLFYVVVMIVIGFMIMFRNKVGGQVVVTIGNSIPKLVLSLVLVTFSFAIIGILIDLGGILRNTIAMLYYGGDGSLGIPVHNPAFLLRGFWKTNFIEPLKDLIPDARLDFWHMIGEFLKNLGDSIWNLIFSLGMTCFVLYGGLKLWITLVKSYFGILINVVVSPLTIAASAIPGNDYMLLETFKSAARNILVFPIAFAIINLPYVLEGAGVEMKFPETLVGRSTMGGDFLPNLLLESVKVVAIFLAATAPEIAKSIIPSTAPKSGGDPAKAIKENMAKVPLIGGIFK